MWSLAVLSTNAFKMVHSCKPVWPFEFCDFKGGFKNLPLLLILLKQAFERCNRYFFFLRWHQYGEGHQLQLPLLSFWLWLCWNAEEPWTRSQPFACPLKVLRGWGIFIIYEMRHWWWNKASLTKIRGQNTIRNRPPPQFYVKGFW